MPTDVKKKRDTYNDTVADQIDRVESKLNRLIEDLIFITEEPTINKNHRRFITALRERIQKCKEDE